ncbi:MAG: DUF2971 domain-containing protein, partial [Thermoplasmatales archaeon]|nr:DUF2971 domain-containing protein [Thermoplasmatales archaeon]
IIFHMQEIKLFKFRTINKYLIDALVKGTIYFAHPTLLNDPFDCKVDIKKAVEHAISCLSGKKKHNLSKLSNVKDFLDRIQQRIGNVGICSFSLVLESPLLWSHYANGHRGLCLTYNIPGEFFFAPENRFVGVFHVDYDDNLLTEWFVENTPEKAVTDLKEFTIGVVNKVLAIKGKDWGYEEEIRIIREKEGNFSIPKDFLKQVCFGLNTPKSDISLVKQIIDNAGYSLEYCQIARSEQDFGLKTVKMNIFSK